MSLRIVYMCSCARTTMYITQLNIHLNVVINVVIYIMFDLLGKSLCLPAYRSCLECFEDLFSKYDLKPVNCYFESYKLQLKTYLLNTPFLHKRLP